MDPQTPEGVNVNLTRNAMLLVTGTVVLASLAGCLGGAKLDVPEDPLSAMGPKLEEWVVLEAHGSSKGTMTSFHWRVPEGSIRASPSRILTLELVPLVDPNTTNVVAWGILTFRLDDRATFEDWHIDMPYTERAVVSNALANSTEHGVSLAPRMNRLIEFEFVEGDTVGFVVLAKTATEAPFPLAIRAVNPKESARDPVATKDVQALVEGGHVPAVAPLGSGERFQVAYYNYLNAAGVPLTEVFAGPVQAHHFVVSETAVPGTAYVFEASAEFESAWGWGLSFGGFPRVGAGVTNWTVDSMIRDSTLMTGRTFAEARLGYGWAAGIYGDSYVHAGEGAARSASTFTVAAAYSPFFHGLYFGSLDLAADMGQLFGLEGANEKRVAEFGVGPPIDVCLPALAQACSLSMGAP